MPTKISFFSTYCEYSDDAPLSSAYLQATGSVSCLVARAGTGLETHNTTPTVTQNLLSSNDVR